MITIRDRLEFGQRHPNPPRCRDVIIMPQGVEADKVKEVLDHMLNDNVQLRVSANALYIEGDYIHNLVSNIHFALKFIQVTAQVLDTE